MMKRRQRKSRVPRPVGLIVPLGRTHFGLPATQVVKMKYATYLAQTCTTGVMNSYVFSANSIFDPDVTSIGHQPLGHDQWAVFYNNYCVVGARIKLVSGAAPSSSEHSVIGVILLGDSSLTASTWNALSEQGIESMNLIAPSSAQLLKTAGNAFDARRWFNVHEPGDALSRIGAAFGSNPSERAYFVVFMQSANGSGTSSTVSTVEIEYDVLLSEPKEIAQS